MTIENERNEFRPRLIMWELGSGENVPRRGASREGCGEPLTTHECLLILESIAGVSKPIVVFTGNSLLERQDIFEIVAYGNAFGLKTIIEARADELSEDVLRTFHKFGGRIFRIMLNSIITEDEETRYKQSPEFLELEKTVERMRKAGFEIHFGVKVGQPNARKLSYDLDYAIRRSARGLYCHLWVGESDSVQHDENDAMQSFDDYIERMAEIKNFAPSDMYFSPQCVRYRRSDSDETVAVKPELIPEKSPSAWKHSCVGGKSFAFITSDGIVRVCEALSHTCGDLRASRYDFKRVWEESEVFKRLRKTDGTCSETRQQLRDDREVQPVRASNESGN